MDAGGQDSGTDAGGPDALHAGSVLILHMDEVAWTGIAAEVVDSSGLGNHGRSFGANTTEGGKFGRAGLFAGSSCVRVPDAPSLRPTSALTFAAWIYPTTLDGRSQGIIAKRKSYQDNASYQMSLYTENRLWVDIDAQRASSTMTFAANQWYHVAVVFDGSLGRTALYVNGVFDSSYAAGAAITEYTATVAVGCLPLFDEPAQYFLGKIDEVAIWARALSAAEIAQVYSSGPL